MYRSVLYTVLSTIILFKAQAQKVSSVPTRPKLVVGIVIDQMRWDYLYRYYDRYSNDGFKRLINEGFSCENTYINYLPSYTAVGHTTIFTGSVPAFHGITGNEWIDQLTGKSVYCTEDSTVQGINNKIDDKPEDGKMSPRNLQASTITDELRIATNYQSKVIGISLKDRAAILPAGHTANAAFWLDDSTGHFISSTYYMQELPEWVKKFNNKDRITRLIGNGWNTMYSIKSYLQSDTDEQKYEGKYPGESGTVFPHAINDAYKKKKRIFRSTPFGNTLTLEFAKEAIDAYDLGQKDATDFLTINFASTDYVGHMYGPNSIEMEDTYLRLDKDLGNFFQLLDKKVGKDQYLVFLTADHGAAHNIGYMQKHNLPADYWDATPICDTLNKILTVKFGVEKIVRDITNYQVNFDMNTISDRQLNYGDIKKATVNYLQQQPGINYAIDIAEPGVAPLPEPLKTMITNGYNVKRSGAIQIILNPGWFEGHGKTGTSHGTWNPYDTHIPLLFYGWNIHPGKTNREVHMTDISATISALLHIQMPNGCVGKVIEEVIQ